MTRDGLLARIRVPAGRIAVEQLRQVAVLAGPSRTVEITNRANLQVRGLEMDQLKRLERGLIDIGLLDCDGQDPTTSVLCSPTAGVDPAEVFDVTTLLPAIEDVLGSLGDAVDPKFGILLDGGGQIHVRCRRQAMTELAGSSESRRRSGLHSVSERSRLRAP